MEGEVSGLKRSGPGHLYFCLKDDEAQLDCVLFSREAARLKFTLEEGMAVRCRGRLTLYEARGRFQMSVADIEPTGAGVLALAFEQLKQRLEAEGLFDPARKRPLPFLPRRLGVVTSPQGAVVRDIIRIAHRRFPVPSWCRPAPFRARGPRWRSRRRCGAWRRSTTSTSSSSRAAADRWKISGPSTRSRWRGPSSPAASR